MPVGRLFIAPIALKNAIAMQNPYCFHGLIDPLNAFETCDHTSRQDPCTGFRPICAVGYCGCGGGLATPVR